MKKTLNLILAATLCIAFVACDKEDDSSPETVVNTVDNSQPSGTFTANGTGMFTDQSSAGTMGSVSIGTDSDGEQFIEFSDNFTTNFNTGTVTVYMSTSSTFTADPMNGNPDLILVGPVKSGGKSYLKVNPTAGSSFTHVILWCGSANVPFGNAQVQ